MNKLFRMIYLFVLLVGLSSPLRAQQLSDDQVIALVKEQKTAGKSDQEIGRLLVSRGVTREQLHRLVQNFMTTAATDSTGAWQEIFADSTEEARRQLPPERRIYGHDLFGNRRVSFEPNENMATPQNYRL